MPPLDVAPSRPATGAPPGDDVGQALLEGLDRAQRAAVVETVRPLAIIAGAGSGKTRVLTRRIAWHAATDQLDLDRVLAVTFTRKAAGELVRRLERLPGGGRVTAGTFHALALAQLRRRWQERGHSAPALLERKARLLVPMLENTPDAIGRAAAVAGEIEWAKARLVDPDHYTAAVHATGRKTVLPVDEVAALYAAYEQQKQRRRLIDFDDLIALCVRAIEGDGDFAAAQRFRFRHLFVDEFQDVTPAQLRLLRAWLGGRDDLCVVGDPDQSIYRFTGAEPAYLRDFGAHFPGAAVVMLDRNYRSTAQVLATARAALATPAIANVRPVRADGPAPTFVEHQDAQTEASAVASAIRDLYATGRPWGTIAVLYRTNAQSVVFEEALTRADVPLRVRGGSRFLDRREVATVLDVLVENARRVPGRRFTDQLVDLHSDAAVMPEPLREHADAVLTLAREYLTHDGADGSVDGFLAWLRATLRSGDTGLDGSDAVDLLTFHGAKGLEYETVFVCGVERGFVPITHATTAEDFDEERRLLYVALSRAQTALHVSWARERALGSRVMPRDPSPWLETIATTATGSAHEATSSRSNAPREALRRARELLATRTRNPPPSAALDATAIDDPLLDALEDWRRATARAAAVPAYVVATDAMLRAIAAMRPQSSAELASLPGIGPARLARYGPSILAIVAATPL